MTIQLTPLLAASFSLFLRVLLAIDCDYLPGLVAGGMKDFCVGLFFAYTNIMRQIAPLLFDRVSRQENCLAPLSRPDYFAAKCRFDRDRCRSFLDALRILLSISSWLLSSLSSRLRPTCAARDTGLFLSPFTLSEGKNDLCYRLIDRSKCLF